MESIEWASERVWKLNEEDTNNADIEDSNTLDVTVTEETLPEERPTIDHSKLYV